MQKMDKQVNELEIEEVKAYKTQRKFFNYLFL